MVLKVHGIEYYILVQKFFVMYKKNYFFKITSKDCAREKVYFEPKY